MQAPPRKTTRTGSSPFILYVAIVLTIAMLLFPPFTSLNGTEYAFFMTGPEWSRRLGVMGEDLGLTAHIHWMALIVQVAIVWAIALGATWFFGTRSAAPPAAPSLLFVTLVLTPFLTL